MKQLREPIEMGFLDGFMIVWGGFWALLETLGFNDDKIFEGGLKRIKGKMIGPEGWAFWDADRESAFYSEGDHILWIECSSDSEAGLISYGITCLRWDQPHASETISREYGELICMRIRRALEVQRLDLPDDKRYKFKVDIVENS